MAGSDLPPLPILLCSPGPGLGYTTASYILPVGCLLPAELQAIPWPQAQPTSRLDAGYSLLASALCPRMQVLQCNGETGVPCAWNLHIIREHERNGKDRH